MDNQERCALLDLGPLPLESVWSHVSKLKLHNRKSLMMTCKKSMQTFGRCLAMVRISMHGRKQGPSRGTTYVAEKDNQDSRPLGTASYYSALRILAHLGPNVLFPRLELVFTENPGVVMTPTLESFIQSSWSHFERLTELQMDCVAVRDIYGSYR